jgi:hypothetical protein
MLVNVSALKVSINNVNNTKYEITRTITNDLNETLSNVTVYFELPKDSIVESSANFKDSKMYFVIESLAPGESLSMSYSFLTRSDDDLSLTSFKISEKEISTNPLTAFISLARDNKEAALVYLISAIMLSSLSLIYILRNDISKLMPIKER